MLFRSATAQAYHDHARTMATLTLHDQRLTRKFRDTKKTLESTQAARAETEALELARAVELKRYHEHLQAEARMQAQKEGRPSPAFTPYDPRCDGFVFSAVEIDGFKDRLHRRGRAKAFANSCQAA